MKKVMGCCLLFVTLMVFNSVKLSAEERAFSDIHGHWAEEYIMNLNEYGLISGYADNTFRPDNVVTRSEMICWVTRVIKLKMGEEKYRESSAPRDTKLYEVSSPISLKDYFKGYLDLKMPEEYWAKQAIEEGKWLNILPYDSMSIPQKVYLNRADYNQPISRGEAAYCVTRAAEWFREEFPIPDRVFYSYASDHITDVDNCPEFPVQCYVAYLQGFFSGYEDKTFRPEKQITRAEVAVVLLKLLEPERAAPFLPNEVPVKLYHMDYRPDYSTMQLNDMIPRPPQLLYPPYYRAEKRVVYEILDLARIMDNSAAELNNYEEGGYRNFNYNNNDGILSISFYESYKTYIKGTYYSEFLEEIDFGRFRIYLGFLKTEHPRNSAIVHGGRIYEFKLNNHWEKLRAYHWDAIVDICSFLLEEDAEILLNKIKEFGSKTVFEYRVEHLDLNDRKVSYREIENGNLMIAIEVK